jgi:hypothetical protein
VIAPRAHHRAECVSRPRGIRVAYTSLTSPSLHRMRTALALALDAPPLSNMQKLQADWARWLESMRQHRFFHRAIKQEGLAWGFVSSGIEARRSQDFRIAFARGAGERVGPEQASEKAGLHPRRSFE